jgi:hypothetical protein
MAGPLITAMNQIRELLADCYWWQNLDVDNPRTRSEALSAIYVDALPKPIGGAETRTREQMESLRPYAILQRSPGDGFRATASSVSGCHVYRGHTVLTLRIGVPETLADDEHALGLWIEERIDRIIKTGDSDKPGLLDLGVWPDRLMIRELTADVYYRVEEQYVEALGDFVIVDLDLWWGPS